MTRKTEKTSSVTISEEFNHHLLEMVEALFQKYCGVDHELGTALPSTEVDSPAGLEKGHFSNTELLHRIQQLRLALEESACPGIRLEQETGSKALVETPRRSNFIH